MAKGTLVRVSDNTKEAITSVAAAIQLELGKKVSVDLAIRAAIQKAYPEIAKQWGIDVEKEITTKKDDAE